MPSEPQPISLPPELWLAIIHYLPPQTLQPLRSINRVFFDLTTTIRYRVVRIDRVNGYLGHVLDSLRNPDIARRVQSLVLHPCLVYVLQLKEKEKPRTAQNPKLKSHSVRRVIQTLKDIITDKQYERTKDQELSGEKPTLLTSTEIKQALADIVPLLINIDQFDLDYDRLPEPVSASSSFADSGPMFKSSFSTPYVDLILQLHAQNLVSFKLAATPFKIKTLVADWLESWDPPLFFPVLKVFGFNIRSDFEDTDSLSTERRDKEFLQAQLGLSLLVNSFKGSLEQLSVRCNPIQDLSLFYLSLTQFEHLRALDVDVSVPPPIADAHTNHPPIPLPLTTFIQSHHLTLQKLSLSTSVPFNPSSTYQFSFAALTLPQLQSLQVSAEVLALSWEHTLTFLTHHASTLKSLAIEGPIARSELAMLVGVLNHREGKQGVNSCVLSCLSISVYQVDVGLCDMLARDLQQLKVLKLRIQKVACEATYAINPGQFFPDNPTSEDAHPFPRLMLQSEALKHWELEDITIKRRSCCKDLYLWGLMLLCALCVPKIASFAGNGDTEVPVEVPLVEKPPPEQRVAGRAGINWCSKNRVCYHGSDGVQR